MKFFLGFLASFIFLTIALAAEEPDNRTPIDKYRGTGIFSLMKCKLSLRLAHAIQELGSEQNNDSDFAGCIKSGLDTAKQNSL